MKRARTPVEDTASAAPWAERARQMLLAMVAALLVAAPLIPCESAAVMGTHVVVVMAWLLVAAAWATLAVVTGGRPLRMGPVGVAVFAFLAWYALSSLVAVRDEDARPAINGMWQWVAFGVTMLIVRQAFRHAVEWRALCSVMLALAAGFSAFGFYQVGYSNPRARADYRANPRQVLEEAEIYDAPDSPQVRQFEDRLASTEPTGPFALTNSLAGFLVPWWVMLVALTGAMWTGTTRAAWHSRAGVLVLLFAVGACVLLTKSRSAYLAALFGVALLAASRAIPRRWLKWRLLLGLVLALAVVVTVVAQLGWLDREVLTEAPKSLLYRIEYWRSTTAMILDHPWFGCGPGNFQDMYSQYKLPQASETVADPHNFLFEIAATAGLPALGLFLAAMVVVGLRIRRRVVTLGSELPGEPFATPTQVSGRPKNPWQSIYLGYVAGLVFAFPAGWAGGISPGLAHMWVTLPTGLIALWVLHPWVRYGHLAVRPVVTACLALLVNLLAAGGIGFPGVGYLVWLLAALALSAAAGEGPRIAQGEPATRAPAGMQWAAPFVAFLLAGTCYFTMYRPVLSARQQLDLARTASSADARERFLLAAAAADRWSAEPWERLIDVTSRRWIADRSARQLTLFEQAVQEALTRRPHSSSANRLVGDRSLEMFLASGQRERLEQAIRAYARAVERYPNSNILHAQLAWTYHLAGVPLRALRQAEEALRLDSLLPHEELKLAHQTLVGDRPAPGDPAAAGSNAEQRMLEIRNASRGG